MVLMTTQAPFKHGVEFNVEQDDFEFKSQKVEAIFKSRRTRKVAQGKTIAFAKQTGYLPPYQLVARITGYSSRLQGPKLGFSITANGTVELGPHQKVVRPI